MTTTTPPKLPSQAHITAFVTAHAAELATECTSFSAIVADRANFSDVCKRYLERIPLLLQRKPLKPIDFYQRVTLLLQLSPEDAVFIEATELAYKRLIAALQKKTTNGIYDKLVDNMEAKLAQGELMEAEEVREACANTRAGTAREHARKYLAAKRAHEHQETANVPNT